MTITNLRIVSVEPSIVGPEEVFEVVIAFDYSLEEVTDLVISISIGQRRPFGLTRHDVIEFSDGKEIQLPIGVSTYTETFSFQLPESGLIDDGRFIEVSVNTESYREYNAVIFTGYVIPLPSLVIGIVAGVLVLGMAAALIATMMKRG